MITVGLLYISAIHNNDCSGIITVINYNGSN